MKNKLKAIPQNSNTDETEDCLPAQVSLQQLRAIWNDEHHTYSDEELIKIREWLYMTAKLMISVSNRLEKEYALTKQHEIEHETSQSHFIYQGEYRRAS